MLILVLRTDKQEAEVALFKGEKKIAYETWQAHRQLAETIHEKIKDILNSQQKELNDVQGIVVFKGPGSFTGLRIGISVANALADSLQIPIVATQEEEWRSTGISRLQAGANDQLISPDYGGAVHTTAPKH